ncbi:hypothetical protein [Streptomyces sp. NPDC020681]|uniref:hypothetical protein n=1 Tax=Streptomyces sp. NPDC020681 TaxID=3365083 RepID=UPI003799CF56
MQAIPFLVSFITTGRLHGLGIGSTLTQVDEAIHCTFFDDSGDEGLYLRRDYGFVEFSFNPGREWVMTGASIELHRLVSGHEMAEKWRERMNVDFPSHLSWDDLHDALSRDPWFPHLTVKDQGGFLEYRAAATDVSVIVNDDDGEHGWPRQGDVWSVSLWSAERAL